MIAEPRVTKEHEKPADIDKDYVKPDMTLKDVPQGGRRKVPAVKRELGMRPGYMYREANWQIGRAAERAGVTVRSYKSRDRFLAWRKRTARKARNAEKRNIGKKRK